MVGGHHDHDSARLVLFQVDGGYGGRDRGVAGKRFENDRLRRDGRPFDLLSDQEAVVAVAENERRRELAHMQPFQGRSQEGRGLVAKEMDELLRKHFAREGPQASARSACKNDRYDYAVGVAEGLLETAFKRCVLHIPELRAERLRSARLETEVGTGGGAA
jgi:hypothetical protein